jgi:hypothetical protein
MRALILATLLATPLVAETPMTAEEFDAFATGRTLTYQTPDAVFGTEEYLPGQKVRWSDGTAGCYAGSWFAKNDKICFVYQGVANPACWTFVQTGSRVRADFSDDAEVLFYDVVISKTVLPCSGLKDQD